MESSSATEPRIYSVSELNAAARKSLESQFDSIRLRGEVSGVTASQAGHYYFSLKDQNAEIRCVLFASTVYRNRIKQKPEQGKEVVLEGRVTLYSPRGSYQFFVENLDLEQGKDGALFQQFLQLKKELNEKGYFLEQHKQALPHYPRRVGIVTSPTGAAVHDIIRAFNRRNPLIQLRVYPTAVQGESAPAEIAQQIALANRRNDVDILLVSRGGGSLEDLAAFNDRLVADAIFASEIPVVTGIGHQTDVSIADYVADKPLATPTAAAEHISTPSRDEMLQMLTNLASKLQHEISSKLNDLGQRVDLAQRSLVHPEQRITDLQNQFRACQEQLILLVKSEVATRNSAVQVSSQQLLNRSPASAIEFHKVNLDSAAITVQRTTTSLHDKLAAQVESLTKQLETMDPHTILNRGYAIVRHQRDDSIVTNAATLSQGEKVTAQLAKGSLDLNVESVNS